jgi:excisionase family DNA binding protein
VGVDHLLSVEEAAAYLNIPVRTLRNWVGQGKVPHTRIGKHVRFTPEHLAQIVAAGERPVVERPRRSGARSRL